MILDELMLVFIFRGHNMLDSGVHFYETYQTSDNLYMSVGCIEPQFYETFLEKLGVSDDDLPQFDDFDELKTKVAEIFKTKTRDEWCKVFSSIRRQKYYCALVHQEF